MQSKGALDINELRDLISDDPATGIVVWRRDFLQNKAGDPVGYTRKDGTRIVWLGNCERALAPICWAIRHGEWPDGHVRFVGPKGDLRDSNVYLSAGAWRTPEGRSVWNKAYRKSRPEICRGYDLKKTFGIGVAEYTEMLKAQHGVCAICSEPETATRNGRLKMLAVDHNHRTNAIRSLVCTRCNVMLGMSDDDPARLRAAADYLDRHAKSDEEPRTLSLVQMKRSA